MLKTNLPIIKQGLSALGYPDDVSRVSLMLNSVTFVDGSMWAGDEILYPDPKNPKDKINPRTQARGGVLLTFAKRVQRVEVLMIPNLTTMTGVLGIVDQARLSETSIQPQC